MNRPGQEEGRYFSEKKRLTDLPASAKPLADLGVVDVWSDGRDFSPLDLRPDKKRVHRPRHVQR